MPNEDMERIEVIAVLRDELSRPADNAADKIQHLGDEAENTGKDLEGMGNEADNAAKKVDNLSKATDENTKSTKTNTHWQKQQRNERGQFVKDTEKATKETDKLTKSLKKQDKTFMGLIKTSVKWSKIWTVLKWGTIVDGATFLAKALYGVGAAGYAAVAGLSPLSGMLVAYPGLFLSAAQGIGVFRLATMGLAKAVPVLEKRYVSYKELFQALKGMGRNEILFARAIADTKQETRGLRKEVSNKFFAGLSHEVDVLGHAYFPILNKELGYTASEMNRVALYTAKWLSSKKEIVNLQAILHSQGTIIGNMGMAGSAGLQGFLWLLRAAQPMLRSLTSDLNTEGVAFSHWTETHQKDLKGFFNYSYNELKAVLGVVKDFGIGLWNIGKESKSMSKYLGHSFQDIGKNFRDWTESGSGKKSIRSFFKGMIPVVHELGNWTHDLAVDLNKSVMSTPKFLEYSKELRTGLLPAITDLVSKSSGSFIPFLVALGQLADNLANSGVTAATVNVLDDAVWLIGQLVSAVDRLPKPLKDTIFQAAALFGVLKWFGLMKLGSGIGKKIIGGGLGKVGLGTLAEKVMGSKKPIPVYVTNEGWGKGGGPSGPVSTAEKDAAAAGGASMTARILSGLRAVGMASPEGITAAGSTLADWLGSRTVQQRSGLAMQGLSGKLFPNAPGGQPLAKGKWYDPWATQWGSNDAAFLDKTLAGRIRKNPTGTMMMLNKASHDQNIPLTSLIAAMPQTAKAIAQIGKDVSGSMDKAKQSTNDLAGLLVDPLSKNAKQAKQWVDALNGSLSDTNSIMSLWTRWDYSAQQSYTTSRTHKFAGQYFEGGEMKPGIALVGEMGPEAFVNRMGQISMVGLNGPEFRNLGSGAVVPASATADPFHGAVGNAPDWAVDALRKAAGGDLGGSLPRSRPSASEGGSAPYTGPLVHIDRIVASSNVDVEGSITRALRKAEEERLNRS